MVPKEIHIGLPEGKTVSMNYFSYVVARDYGFAPNPFGGICTLATCKQRIRNIANINDWIFGITNKKLGNRLIYAMKVTRILTYNEYWESDEFQFKKPVLNGSLKQMYGDNIYFYDKGAKKWYQENSHHSYEEGETNFHNLNRDTSCEKVLLSEEFFYFGKENIEIDKSIKKDFVVGINHRHVKKNSAEKLISQLTESHERGYNADPISFTDFERYDGVS
ncbi:MAG: hypothetical protein JXJ22_07280 [Bacteroidales bacterium]|nr:hypothetical protein [Bacteroidales bacterium]